MNKIQISDTDMSNLDIVNQVSFGSKSKKVENGECNLIFKEDQTPIAAFGFDQTDSVQYFNSAKNF